MDKVYILLGTNQGNKEVNLSKASSLLVSTLGSHIFSPLKKSSIHESEPWGYDSNESFLNQAVEFETDLEPEQVLALCKSCEARMGRNIKDPVYDERGERVYEDRIIDIDILLFGDRIIDTPKLVIPHPRLEEREFAKIPLREIL
ncbi:MAG: 2-amino-4-hydroxy-6-hydroxymethyldihydropteridine diphosphokinase [Bacteroidales bacterium]